MSKTRLQLLLCVGLMLRGSLVLGAAHADATFCGSQIVENGNNMATVQGRCGPPTFATQRVEYRGGPNRTVQVVIDQWTYDFGPNKFMQIITFEQGIVVSIASGTYGSKTK